MGKAFQIKSIMVRLLGLVAISALGLLGLTFVAADFVKQEKLDAAINKTRNLSEAAVTVMAEFDARAKRGIRPGDGAETGQGRHPGHALPGR